MLLVLFAFADLVAMFDLLNVLLDAREQRLDQREPLRWLQAELGEKILAHPLVAGDLFAQHKDTRRQFVIVERVVQVEERAVSVLRVLEGDEVAPLASLLATGGVPCNC